MRARAQAGTWWLSVDKISVLVSQHNLFWIIIIKSVEINERAARILLLNLEVVASSFAPENRLRPLTYFPNPDLMWPSLES